MPVLLTRHGEAVESQGRDEDRVLSLRGRDEVRQVGRALKLRAIVPTSFVSSPLVRAVQTAELLIEAMGYPGVLSVDPALQPEGDPFRAEARLRREEGLIVAVTPEPTIRVTAARLLDASSHPAFRTAGCALIDGGHVTLRLDPDTL